MLVIPIPFVFNAILLDASYCIKSCRPGVNKLIAATSSNHEIRLYQCANLSMTSKLKGIYINVQEQTLSIVKKSCSRSISFYHLFLYSI